MTFTATLHLARLRGRVDVSGSPRLPLLKPRAGGVGGLAAQPFILQMSDQGQENSSDLSKVTQLGVKSRVKAQLL